MNERTLPDGCVLVNGRILVDNRPIFDDEEEVEENEATITIIHRWRREGLDDVVIAARLGISESRVARVTPRVADSVAGLIDRAVTASRDRVRRRTRSR